MKKNVKKEIRDSLEQLDFEGDLNRTIESLKKTIKEHEKKGYIRFEVEKDVEYDYGCSECYNYHQLYGFRLETDSELEKRIADNKRRRASEKLAAKTRAIKKEEREHKKYLELHAKFGNKK